MEADASECVDLQLQRNHQQLSLLNATEGTVNVSVTFEHDVMPGAYLGFIIGGWPNPLRRGGGGTEPIYVSKRSY